MREWTSMYDTMKLRKEGSDKGPSVREESDRLMRALKASWAVAYHDVSTFLRIKVNEEAH